MRKHKRKSERRDTDELAILGPMLADAMAWHYGLGLASAARISPGAIYPHLARLEAAGWLESSWEERAREGQGGPRRRLYRLTGLGQRVALTAAEKTRSATGPSGSRSPRGSLLPGLEAS